MHCTEPLAVALSCPVEPHRKPADREAFFSRRIRPRSPKSWRPPVQNIDVSAIFNYLSVSGQK